MSSFLKSIFHSSNKHKKLCEEWTSHREPVLDGITFYVRYLGSSLVEDPKSAQSTAAGVKRVIHAAKAGARRPERVSLRVAMEGVRIDSTISGETIMDTSIYKISYCSADSQYEQVLAFVASNEDETCECHAFLCSKRKIAEAIAVSIAQAFSMAYECWQLALEAKRDSHDQQVGGPCEESPPRVSNSRASTPEHSPAYSSPPSEVSSTSGYQSSTTGGLLLELDYADAGSDSALPLRDSLHTSGGASRKHWIDIGSLEGLAFERRASDEWTPLSRVEDEESQHAIGCGGRTPSSSSSSSNESSGPERSFVAPYSPHRHNCSFNGHFSSSGYSLSDSEQKQLLAAVN